MKNIKGFQIILKWPKLESVNRMYIRTKTGMTMSPEARSFKKNVSKQVRNQLPKPLPFTNKDVFKLSLHFIIKSRFFVRDTSNFIKLVEDTIFDELDINDARNLELVCKKSYLKDSPFEYIKATIEVSDFDYEFFNSKKSNWKSDIKKKTTFTKKEVERLLMEQAMELASNKVNKDLKEITRNSAANKPLKPTNTKKKKSKS